VIGDLKLTLYSELVHNERLVQSKYYFKKSQDGQDGQAVVILITLFMLFVFRSKYVKL
jgi:hypothetical protein